ncbi:MAG: hypothetical protein K2Z81_25555, partial [Cyanobacteria bacterium]|nr:hypothetical protein [Cyanobacteriota bacterium]
PEQEAEDAQRLNDFARRLLVIFGVQKPVGEALVRMQAREKTFYDPEHWAERGAWILSEFCAVDPTAS